MATGVNTLRLGLACAWACAVAGGCACRCLPRIDPSGERIFLCPAKDQPQVAPPALAAPSTIVAPPVVTDPVFPLPAAPAVAAAPAAIVAPGVTPASVALAQVPQDKVSITPERILAPVNSEVVLKASVCTTEGYTLADQQVEWMLGRNGVGQFVEVSGKGWFHPPLLPWNKAKKVDNYLATGWTANGPLCITRGTPDPADDVNVNRGDAWISVTSPNEGTSYVTAVMPTVESWEQRKSYAMIYWVDVQWTFPPGSVPSDGRSATLTTTVTRQTNGTPIEGWIVRYELTDGGGNLTGGAGGQVVEVRTDANGQATVQATPTAAGAASTPVNIQLIRPANFGGGDAPRLIVGTTTSLIQWTGSSTYVSPGAGGNLAPTTPPPTIPDTASPISPPGGWGPPSTGGAGTGGTSAPPRPQLDVELSGNQTAEVGGRAILTMRLRNVGTGPATNVKVIDQFDRGLTHASDPSANILDASDDLTGPLTLAQGADVSKNVTFDVVQAGRLCHNVQITCAENVSDSAQFCVTATQPAAPAEGRVEVNKEVAPVVARVGENVRFRVTVKNTGELPLVDVRVTDEYPTAFFTVRPLTQGHTAVSGAISYRIPRLEVGTQQSFEVEARCIRAELVVIPRPRVRVEASTDPPTQPKLTADEVDIEIQPPNPAAGGATPGPGANAGGGAAQLPLTFNTTFYQQPARIGSRAVCEVTVRNNSTTVDQNMELRLVLPPQLVPDMTPGAIVAPPNVSASYSAPQLSFTAVRALRPLERVIFTIPMTVNGPAAIVDIRTDVRSLNLPQGNPRTTPLEISNLQ
jgi:uncharacterized repeat protein (TIGR01451 family)